MGISLCNYEVTINNAKQKVYKCKFCGGSSTKFTFNFHRLGCPIRDDNEKPNKDYDDDSGGAGLGSFW